MRSQPQTIQSADQRWRNSLDWVVLVGHRSKRRNRRHPKARWWHHDGEGDPGQQRRQRKPELTSDQGDDFPLSFSVGLDVSGGRSQAGMTGKLLNVAQAAADLADLPGRACDEASSPGMRRAAHHAEVGIEPMEPYDDGSGRQTPITLAMDDGQIGSSLLSAITM